MLRAFDKSTGAIVGEVELPSKPTAPPMSFMLEGKQYLVVAVGFDDHPSEYVALALKENQP